MIQWHTGLFLYFSSNSLCAHWHIYYKGTKKEEEINSQIYALSTVTVMVCIGEIFQTQD